MFIPVLMLVIGGYLLVRGADLLIDGGVGIALKSGVSHLVVGLTVVAFGTSAPELTVSLTAAIKGSGDICFGNVVGSNITNIALIVGLSALVQPITVNRQLFRWELPFLIFISALTCYVGYSMNVGRVIGIIFCALFTWYIIHCMKSPAAESPVDDEKAGKRTSVLIFIVGLGVIGLGAGGMIFVNGAREIARMLGVSEAIIGLTVVALGTSLPELVTSVLASYRGHSDISLGNIVGSNIFNVLFVIGVTAIISPFSISSDRYLTVVGLPLMFVLAVILMPFARSGRKISRIEGGIFLAVYIGSLVLAVMMAK